MVWSDTIQSVILVIVFVAGVIVIYLNYHKPLKCWNCDAETARPHVPRLIPGTFCEDCCPACSLEA